MAHIFNGSAIITTHPHAGTWGVIGFVGNPRTQADPAIRVEYSNGDQDIRPFSEFGSADQKILLEAYPDTLGHLAVKSE